MHCIKTIPKVAIAFGDLTCCKIVLENQQMICWALLSHQGLHLLPGVTASKNTDRADVANIALNLTRSGIAELGCDHTPVT